ncbi:uncharacterized protein BX663DRAFT_530119 [Cokeromyces recurvatus]|uniref:uncharacterized protein n=1 Tax=Cokeromyces recurvatus TaxID=90255 RepID=UPI002220309A|nr:uncharacterized protein BX663DRAFT_530119 [Cokeromyces recurvatus]KAI7904575.1 hypothetical protein BX663DRAFT_530119 [Cokeromyces recurvatus]
MVLKFLRMGMVTFSLYSLFAIPILFPVNTINQGHLSGLNYLTMGNVTEDRRTWAHCLLAIILSILVWYYTFRETKNYINLRRHFLLSSDYANSVAARTVYIPSIPEEINNVESLQRMFDKFPGGIRRIWLNRQLNDLPDLVQKRQKYALSLEAKLTKAILATYKYHIKIGDSNRINEQGLTHADIPSKIRPTHRESSMPIPLPFFGHKVDSLHFYHNQIKELNDTIAEKQENVIHFSQVKSAFIEFNQQIAAHMAAQTLVYKESMQMAPRYIGITSSDIIWENMNIGSYERLIRRMISLTLTTAIVIFWAIPVVFVQAIANIDTLAKALPFLNAINNMGPTAVGIIQGILPAVFLSILISLVPIIFTILSKNEGIPQRSFVQLSLLHKFFFFQLVDVVLVSTLSGGFMTIVDKLNNFVHNPFEIINVLSTNLPKASTFFITFVMLQSTNQSGQSMVQVVPFLLSYVKPFFNTTPRDLYNAKISCLTVNLGTLIPSQTVIFILGLEYGVISPLILPFVCLFFILQYFVHLYQFLYVYEINHETAGRHFPRAIRHIYIGLIISQLTLVGLFAIRSGARGQLGLMIVTLILTCFVLYYYDRAFKPLLKYLPISDFSDPAVDHHKGQVKRDEIHVSKEEVEHHDQKAPDHMKEDSISDDLSSPAVDTAEEEEEEDSTGSRLKHRRHHHHLSKLPTHSSIHSPTQTEGHHAHQQLLKRLYHEKQKSLPDIQRDQDRIIHTAKSLYDVETYLHPSVYTPCPTIWIPEDDLGITQKEIQELKLIGIEATSRGAAVVRNDKGKGSITIDEQSIIHDDQGMPGGLSSINRQESDINDFVRVWVDSFNFAEAITIM